MSDATGGGKYEPWREAANQGNLLSYLWANRPSMGQLVEGYSADEPWYQKALDYASIPARLAIAPLREAGSATETALHSPELLLDPQAQRNVTKSLLDFGLAYGGAGEGLPAFPAWHGSRHVFAPEEGAPFGRFDESKMSTGEGAQAYAWGHYIGGARSTAETYRTAGEHETEYVARIDGKNVDYRDFANTDPHIAEALMRFELNRGDYHWTLRELSDNAKRLESMPDHAYTGDAAMRAADRDFDLEEAGRLRDAHEWLVQNRDRVDVDVAPNQGNLYQVWVRPEKHELLDWDRPLSEQSEKVRNILTDKFPREIMLSNEQGIYGKGGEIYRDLVNSPKREPGTDWERQASEELDAAGIPGVKFLDQRSRALPGVIHLGDNPWAPASAAEDIVARAMGKLPRTKHTAILQNTLDIARERLQNDIDLGMPIYSPNVGDRPVGPEVHLKRTQDAIDWIDQNRDKMRMGDHPDATHNYVIFHHRHVNVIDRNGQVHGLEPVDHDPFE